MNITFKIYLVRQMKKIILTIIIIILTILNIMLFRDYYNKKEDNKVNYKIENYN